MNITDYQITNAINAAEVVSKPFAPANEPVAITQETLQVLIECAKRLAIYE
jgi:hypothetical protein